MGSNLYVHDTGSNVLVVDGNVNVSNTISTHRLTLNNVSITTTMDLAQVSNVGNVTSNVLQFTNPTTAFVTTGAVGIGTASPRDVEHIWKDGSNGDHGLLIEQNNAGTGSATLKFGVAHTTESTTGLSKAGIFFRRADTKGRGDLLFCVDNANDTNDVDTSNHAMTIYRDGNVGIGTASPDSIFHTYSGAGADEVWVDKWKHSFDANWNFRLSQRHDHGINVEYGFKQRYNTTEYSPITFRGSTMELSGNVGIGTTSPTSMLELAANGGSSMITLKRTNTSNGGAKGGIRFTENTNGYNVGVIACLGDGANTSGALCFYTKASSTETGIYLAASDERMRISSSGNVGIGENNPIGRLDVKTSGSATSGGNVGAWDSTFVKFGPNSGTTGGAISFGAGLSTDYKTYTVSLAPAVAWCSHRHLAESWYWFYGSNQRMYLANNGNLTISGTYRHHPMTALKLKRNTSRMPPTHF